MKEDISETVVLELSTGEETNIACDTTVLFPNGEGFQIVGITREEIEEIGIDVRIENNEEVLYQIKKESWLYIFECIPIGGDGELKFCTAVIKILGLEDLNITGSVGLEGKPNVKVPKEYEMDLIEIQFASPVYVWDHELEWEVTVAEVEKE